MPKSDEEVWYEWRSLVNMTAGELQRFLDEWGDVAGLSRAEAKAQGIRSGRDSARAILRMLPKGGRSYPQAERNWTTTDWEWARRQVGFIKRMRGARGALYDAKGEPTRKLLALLVWGHDPEKMEPNPIAYHGTPHMFAPSDARIGWGMFGPGLYLTSDRKTAEGYATGEAWGDEEWVREHGQPAVLVCDVELRKPIEWSWDRFLRDGFGWVDGRVRRIMEDNEDLRAEVAIAKLQKLGYDGVIVPPAEPDGHVEYVVFDPTRLVCVREERIA